MSAALIIISILASAGLVAILFYFSIPAGAVALCVFSVLWVLGLWNYFSKIRYNREVVRSANQYFDTHGGSQSFPMAVAVAGKDGSIIWYNQLFEKQMLSGRHLASGNISEFIGSREPSAFLNKPEGIDVEYRGRKYSIFAGSIDEETESYCFFFVDNTDLKFEAREYRRSYPSVLYIKMDNLDQIYSTYRNSECEVIGGEVETILEGWAQNYPCLFKRISGGRYYMIIEERGLQKLLENHFDILKKVREYRYGGRPLEITLSIGVGCGNSIQESDECAVQALEMSQSRGGDQATVNRRGELQFYGGTVGGTTKSSKVKARITATALAKYMMDADVIFASGHSFADLDSIGASAGIYEMASALGKPCYILSDREKSMAVSLIDSLEKSYGETVFVDEAQARSFMRGRSAMLVVVDTHRPTSVEFPALNDEFDTVAVIDHHRRTPARFENSVVFYDEPNASSASEMVTELLQYIQVRVKLNPMSAEALLSGIMLDTRNFVLRTGVRTFEAAAYLKSHGADTVAVKQLFANSMENYKIKESILSSAYTFKDCAIAVTSVSQDNMRMIASQVADDLMSVVGIKSSYVVFSENGKVSISARSLGEMNVQVIMEKLNGGGHFTMAATQLDAASLEEAEDMLKAAITEYLEME